MHLVLKGFYKRDIIFKLTYIYYVLSVVVSGPSQG